MRENMGLFRGKGVSGYHLDEWVYGYYCKDFWKPRKGHGIIPINEDDGGYVEVDPETVGECTGLKDKNGKLIFEGDIVKGSNILHSNRKIYQVAFDDGSFELFDHKGVGWHHSHIDNKEVIGNIHDNPELLEVNK